MVYTLDQFIVDARIALQTDKTPSGREKVRGLVEKLLQNKDFLATAFPENAEAGRRKIYEEPGQGFVILAHVAGKAGKSPPHDHGPSWAVYGQVTGHTDMTVWKRLDSGSGGGDAALEKVTGYRLNPGEVGKYDVGDIHSIAFTEGARFLRVTGKDLDYVGRLKYDADAGKAIVIESASAQ
jgi:hypothetical protein